MSLSLAVRREHLLNACGHLRERLAVARWSTVYTELPCAGCSKVPVLTVEGIDLVLVPVGQDPRRTGVASIWTWQVRWEAKHPGARVQMVMRPAPLAAVP